MTAFLPTHIFGAIFAKQQATFVGRRHKSAPSAPWKCKAPAGVREWMVSARLIAPLCVLNAFAIGAGEKMGHWPETLGDGLATKEATGRTENLEDFWKYFG